MRPELRHPDGVGSDAISLDAEPDGTLRLRPYRTIADSARGLFAEDVGLVDELLAERRAAATRED